MMEFTFSHSTPTRPNDRYWTFGVGSCHAALALRADYQAQLQKARDELGFQRVRFHGLFNDDMKVVTWLSDYVALIPGAKKVRTQSFHHIALVFDFLLSIGMKPFVELSFMPSALASGKATTFYYKGNITLPKRREEWRALLRDFLRFCIDRYGRDEVRSWHFEVWNEPNLPFFFRGSQKEYFQFYADTVRALKEVDEQIQVGGPATSENLWLPEMQAFCKQNHVPLDFLSTHHYPGDDLGLPIFSAANLKRFVFTALQNPKDHVVDVVRKMLYHPEKEPLIRRDSMRRQAEKVRGEAGGLPLYYTEWNVNPTCTAPAHDTARAAAFLVKHVMDCQGLMDGCAYWAFSDIFEELTFFTRPFSGSFGLQTIHGIPKPSYHAFALLNRLGTERYDLPVTDAPIELAAFRKEGTLQFLLYRQNYCEGSAQAEPVRLLVDVPLQSATAHKIDRAHCNPLQYWRDMGAPETLLPGQAEEIISATALKEEPLAVENTPGGAVMQAALADNDVWLIEAKQ